MEKIIPDRVLGEEPVRACAVLDNGVKVATAAVLTVGLTWRENYSKNETCLHEDIEDSVVAVYILQMLLDKRETERMVFTRS